MAASEARDTRSEHAGPGSAGARALTAYRTHSIINVNVNILLSTATASSVAGGIIAMLSMTTWFNAQVARLTVATAVIEGLLDALCFVSLHALANRKGLQLVDGEARTGRAVLDGAKFQLHRAILSPLFYFLAMGGQATLLSVGVAPGWSVPIAYMHAILICRVLHTVVGLRVGFFAWPGRERG